MDVTSTKMTIMSDEDGEIACVPIDEATPTPQAVEDGWREAAEREWGLRYDPYDDLCDGPDITRGWWKAADNGEGWQPCKADDPERELEFWRFELPIGVTYGAS